MAQPQPSQLSFQSQETDMMYSSSSPNNDYVTLKRALMNEKASPEILEFEVDLLTRLTYQIEQQEAALNDPNLLSLELGGLPYQGPTDAQDDTRDIIRAMMAIELTRLKYMMRSYLRVRLGKIEKYVMHCIESDDVRQRLSTLEQSYAYDYVRLVGTHLKTHVTSKLPEAFSSVTKQASAHPENDMIPVPDIGHHVFVRVERDLGEIEMYDDGTTQELQPGDLYIMRYKVIKDHIGDGGVQLV